MKRVEHVMRLLPSKITLPNLAALLVLAFDVVECVIVLLLLPPHHSKEMLVKIKFFFLSKRWLVVEETWVTVFLVGEGTTRWRHRWWKGKRAGGRGVPLRATCGKRAWYGEKSIRNPGHLMMSHTQKEHKEGVVGPGKRRKKSTRVLPTRFTS